MGSNSTDSYQLNQWAGGDPFIRTDFNEDNQKIDGALGGLDARLRTLERGIQPMSYHLFQLLLRDYYEEKRVDFRKGLLFDGFRDESQIARRSEALFPAQNALYLTERLQPEMAEGYTTSDTNWGRGLKTKTYPVSAHCMLTGFQTRWRISTYSSSGFLRVYVNGAQRAEKKISNVGAIESLTNVSFELPPVFLVPGDSVYVELEQNAPSQIYSAQGAEGSEAGGALVASTRASQTATLTSTPYQSAGTFDRALAWVRHCNGEVRISLVPDEGAAVPLERVERRETVNLQGTACVEDAYLLDRPGTDGGALAVSLDLSLGGDAYMEVFDYGVALQ